MHGHRPLYDLYMCALRPGVSSGTTHSAMIPTDLGPDSVCLGRSVQGVLADLESHLPEEMVAYLAVVDEHYAVPLVDGTRCASTVGLANPRPRLYSPEAHALLNHQAGLVVPDLRVDQRFAPPSLPAGVARKRITSGAPASGDEPELGDIRFFAAQPVLCAEGDAIAVVCVRSAVPTSLVEGRKTWTSGNAAALAQAAEATSVVLEHSYHSRMQHDKRRMIDRT